MLLRPERLSRAFLERDCGGALYVFGLVYDRKNHLARYLPVYGGNAGFYIPAPAPYADENNVFYPME